MLELRNIKKDYVTASETVNALRGVDITFRDREFVSILGPSGCGKTTTGRTIIKLYEATGGDVYFKGQRICAGTRAYKNALKKAKGEFKAKEKELKAIGDEKSREELERLEKEYLKP